MLTFSACHQHSILKNSSCLCIGLFSDDQQLPRFEGSEHFWNSMKDMIKKPFSTSEIGVTQLIPPIFTPFPILLISLGKRDQFNIKSHNRALDTIISKLPSLPSIEHLHLCLLHEPLHQTNASQLIGLTSRKFIENSYHISNIAKKYGVDLFRDLQTSKKIPEKLCIYCQVPANIPIDVANNDLRIGENLAKGVNMARFLGDLPGNICTPSFLSFISQKLAEEYPATLSFNVLDEKRLKALKMDTLLTVSQGSAEPAKLIEIHYHPSQPSSSNKPIVLVGKGVTFDSGGISLKPAAKMDEMKFDMCGAASVIGTMYALAENRSFPSEVIGIIPATENMPSGTAVKPGDIVRSHSGQTVEILNTDAEGRLILADTLSYAEQKYKPKIIIDIATLTGACVIALGNYRSAIMTNDNSLVQQFLDTGSEALDPCWQLPLDDEYDELLRSNFAHMANIGNRVAGSITAGCFLKRFVRKTPWVHLDIAGVAWREGRQKGATGRPVPLLFTWILKQENPITTQPSLS